MASKTEGAYSVYVGTDDFGSLARDLRASAARFRGVLQTTMTETGDTLTKQIRAKSSEHSTSIPPTVKGRSKFGEYEIDAGGPDVPLAGLYEFGNRGKSGKTEPEFQHPVFGNYPMVWQWRYPFVAPVWEAHKHEIYAKLDAVWDLAFRSNHIFPEPLP